MIWIIGIAWYLVGVFLLLYIAVEVYNEDVHLHDLLRVLLLGFFGPIVPLVTVLFEYHDKVIIKRRNKE